MSAHRQILTNFFCLTLAVISGRTDRASFFLAGIGRAVCLRRCSGSPTSPMAPEQVRGFRAFPK
ncbi:MAG: hypothetical protein WCS65_11270 [Verrucomicrobiae bacterium]